MAQDLSKIEFTTAYPVDKIIDTIQGSFSLPQNNVVSHAHPINPGRMCFSEMLYSIDNDNFYACGQEVRVGTASLSVVCEVGSNDVTFYAANFSAGNQTIYYRVMLIWPV